MTLPVITLEPDRPDAAGDLADEEAVEEPVEALVGETVEETDEETEAVNWEGEADEESPDRSGVETGGISIKGCKERISANETIADDYQSITN